MPTPADYLKMMQADDAPPEIQSAAPVPPPTMDAQPAGKSSAAAGYLRLMQEDSARDQAAAASSGQQAPEAAKPGWADYVFRGAPMNAILGIGDALRKFGDAQDAGLPIIPPSETPPSGRQAANQILYGAPEIQPPNDYARYGGAVTSAFAANPVFGALTPGYTVAGALGSEAGSDIKPSWMPDWMARLIGGVAGGGIYGVGKAGVTAAAGRVADAVNGTDRALQTVADTKARIAAGEGRYGDFQQLVGKASDALQKDAAGMPTLAPDTKVPLQNTWSVLNSGGPSTPLRDQLREALTPGGNKITAGQYGNHLDWMKAAGGTDPALYVALKNDLKTALSSNIGPDAPAAFDKANLARQGLFMLDKAQNPSGFHDPSALTKALAKSFNGEDISAINPAMDALTSRASELHDLQQPWMRANVPTSAIGAAARKAAEVGGALIGGKVVGSPEIGALIAGTALGHADKAGSNAANLLYGLPSAPWGPRLLPMGYSANAALPGLLTPPTQQ